MKIGTRTEGFLCLSGPHKYPFLSLASACNFVLLILEDERAAAQHTDSRRANEDSKVTEPGSTARGCTAWEMEAQGSGFGDLFTYTSNSRPGWDTEAQSGYWLISSVLIQRSCLRKPRNLHFNTNPVWKHQRSLPFPIQG